MNLPTKITVSRIVMVIMMIIALFVVSIIPNLIIPDIPNTTINWFYFAYFIVFVIAASSDYLDGYIARKYNMITDLGKFLDPIADKLLVNSTLIFLVLTPSFAPNQNVLPQLFICVIIMIARDLIVDALRLIAVQKNVVIAANIFGKAKTVAQMIAIPFLLLNDWPFSYFDSSWPEALKVSNILMYIATLLSLLSGIIYVYQNRKVLSTKKEENEDSKP